MAATTHSNYYELSLIHPDWTDILYPPVYDCGYSDTVDAANDDGVVSYCRL
jgi:hypothetical protein